MSIRGWVYIIDNEAMPNILKIGFSTKDPTLRAKELAGTGSPHPFRVVFDVLVEEPRDVEHAAHAMLASKREGKEWFRCSHSDAIAAIRACAKSIFIERNNSEEYQSPQEQFDLAWMYIQGKGVHQDNKEAVKYFRLAADQGYAPAQHNLGEMYELGQGVPQGYEEATKWYQLAAEQGYAQAQTKILGEYFTFSIPIMLPDRTQKFDGVVTYKRENLYRMVVGRGDIEAQFIRGKIDYKVALVLKRYGQYGKWYGLSSGGRTQDIVGRIEY